MPGSNMKVLHYRCTFIVIFSAIFLNHLQVNGQNKCDKCNIPIASGGCKCDNNCDCRPGLGGNVCDKCNIAVNDGGCKCDNTCSCIIACQRPNNWCTNATATFVSVDCDGDGVLDIICYDGNKKRWMRRTSDQCQEKTSVPDSACPAVFMKLPPPARAGIVNLALSSRTIVASSQTTGSRPSYAADGNNGTLFHSAYPEDVGSGSESDFNPYVGLELSQLSTISKIVILNRPGFEYRLQNAEVRVGTNAITNRSSTVDGNAVVWKQTATQGSVIEISLNPPVVGRWVSLQNLNPTTWLTQEGYPYVLNFLEIQVLGVPLAVTVVSNDVATRPWSVNPDTASNYISAGAQWIWATSASAIYDAPVSGFIFQKNVTVTSDTPCNLALIADDQCDVQVNDMYCGSIVHGWGDQLLQTVAVDLLPGENVISLRCVNQPLDDPLNRGNNPAGIIAALRTASGDVLAQTDSTWVVAGAIKNICEVRKCPLGKSCRPCSGRCL
ncbi:hypothetical protein Vafri_20869 [Volvox africanus]|uniref:F5/8 type C domain-containing protein n=1 Tax=Volvox africanus TaxID=51714 RepID=A0A8J4BQY4_9CHLO|nr:hypothetical protein Vafri_20869 [Volvox africanus]GIL67513.1 hypothetical protein Vafri_20869 [Volvox africanus]GIL67514.1 hypothetical protein Vafri_20869 [Volvox africanus]GIL67515.1 hypothetical protein Vafri_20869 [Volvox africanus]